MFVFVLSFYLCESEVKTDGKINPNKKLLAGERYHFPAYRYM
jgi:hypothetical protein